MEIPRYDAPTVQPTVQPTPHAQARDANSFGAQVGSSLQNVGAEMLDYAHQEQTKANSAVVMGRIAKLNESRVNLLNHPQNGLLNRQGESAINISQEGMESYDKAYRETMDGLTPEQTRLFKQHTANERNEVLLQLSRHEAQQSRVAQIDNASALVDSHVQVLGTLYNDPQAFDAKLKQVQAAVLDKVHMEGFADNSPYAQQALATVTSKAHAAAIEQIAETDPVAAHERLKTVRDQLTPTAAVHLEKELKPKLDAYAVDDVLAQVKAHFQDEDPDAEQDPDKRYEVAKTITKDPNVRKLVSAEIDRETRKHNEGLKQRFATYSGHIYKSAHEAWDSNEEYPVSKVMASPEFGKLPEDEQAKVLDKVNAENRIVESEKHKRVVEARTEKKEAERERREKRREEKEDERERKRVQKEEWDKNFNYYNTHPEELSQLTEAEFSALSGGVSHADYKQLTTQRKKLTNPQALSHAVIEADTLAGILHKAGITDPAQEKEYGLKAKQFVAAAQKEAKHPLSPKEIQSTLIEGLQHVAVNEKVRKLGFTGYYDAGYETTIKRRMDVKHPDSIIIPDDVQRKFDTLEKKRGVKLTPERRRRLFDEMLKEQTAEAAK